jgi:hypothetical protein
MPIWTTSVKYDLDKSTNHETTNQHELHKHIRKQTSINTFTSICVKLEINYMNSMLLNFNLLNQCTVSHNNVVFPPILRRSIHIKGQRAGNDNMYITYWILLRLLVALSVLFLFSLLFHCVRQIYFTGLCLKKNLESATANTTDIHVVHRIVV